MNTSSGIGRRMCGGQQAQIAITSRWKCIVPFGWPVVPDVNAMMQVSSADVSTFTNSDDSCVIARSSDPSAIVLKHETRTGKDDRASAIFSSSARAKSHSACDTCALSMTFCSSTARSNGMVATAMPPAFITPNHAATIIGLFGARSSTRLPGTRPICCTSTFATRFAWRCNSAYVHVVSAARIQIRSPRPSAT